jgi:hypothetical protein
MLLILYPKNSVTISVEPLSVMVFFVACAIKARIDLRLSPQQNAHTPP